MFERIISVDWSGAGSETDGVDLRIAVFDATTNESVIVDRPYQKRTVASWSRKDFRAWVVEQLQQRRPSLIAFDFGFGLPWGTDQAVFRANGWRQMVRNLSEIYGQQGTARATAQAINAYIRFGGNGPYRFDESRNNFRFYLDYGIAYFRHTELLAPQGISQWYLGSGGTVGFHTISGLSALDYLIRLREAGVIDFEIWPHETLKPDGSRNVLVESYPAITPSLQEDEYGACRQGDPHQRDAWRVLHMLVARRGDGTLADLFEIQEQRCGRITGVDFLDQIQFEGFIFGLR